ncbi:MAG: DUF1801 domain-containing protein [Halioglobus sp.]|nr:DUF1801 domain-containing protein [Halioglobus sp.]
MPSSPRRKPPKELFEYLQPYDKTTTGLFLEVRDYVLLWCPSANELIYDAYNAVSCVYAFTENTGDAFCHVAAYPSHVNLGFNRGAALDDPHALLEGSGKHIRHIPIHTAADLLQVGCEDLLLQAIGQCGIDSATGSNKPIIKTVSGKKLRPG